MAWLSVFPTTVCPPVRPSEICTAGEIDYSDEDGSGAPDALRDAICALPRNLKECKVETS